MYLIRLDFHHFVNDADIRLVWSPSGGDDGQAAVATARAAAAVILVMGLSPRLEGEEMKLPVEGCKGGDRAALELARVQQELMEQIAAAGKPSCSC